MEKKFLYIILGILLAGAMVWYGIWTPCKDIKPLIDQKNTAIEQEQRALSELNSAKVAYENEMKRREERRKSIELNKGKLKEIYEFESMPPYMDMDSLFGKMMHDVISIAKKNGLKVRSMVFYSNTEKEPLVLGQPISIDKELENIGKKPETKADEKTDNETSTTGYKAYQVDFGFMSSYSNLNKFIEALSNYKYLVKVRKLETYPYPDDPKILMSNVSLVLYVHVK